MGIKEYILNKRQSKKEKDIVETLDTTIKELEDYLWKLKTGQVHDVKKYEGSKNEE